MFTRDFGFYWVKFFKTNDWVVAEWIGHCWLYSRTGQSEKFNDSSLHEIDENRIIRNEPKSECNTKLNTIEVTHYSVCTCVDRSSFYRDKEDNDICYDCNLPLT